MTKNSARSADPPSASCIICDCVYRGHQPIEGDHWQNLSSCGSRLLTTGGSGRAKGDDRGMNLQLCSQLPVILFARKILRIPSQFLESLLRDNGDPSQWGIDLCRACMGVFKKAEVIYSKIIKLIEEFEGLADKLREELKESDRRKSSKNEVGAETLPETKASRKGNKRTKGRGIQKELIRNVTDKTSASLNLRQEFLRISCETNQEIQTNVEKGSKLKTPITVGYEDFSRVGKVELEGDEDLFNLADDLMDHDDSSSPQCFEEMADSSADVQSESTETRSIPQIPPVKANLNGRDKGNEPDSEDVEEDNLEGGHKKSKARLDKNEDDTRGGTMKNDGSDKESSVSAIPSEPSHSSEGFYCDICAKRRNAKRRRKILYKTKDMLESHKRKVHQRMAKPFECKLCRRFFSHNYLLHRHILAHPRLENKIKRRNERPFCKECDREFKNMRNLKLHLQTKRHLPPVSILKKKKPGNGNSNGNNSDNIPNSEAIDEDNLDGGHKESKAQNGDDKSDDTMKEDGSDRDPHVLIIPSQPSDRSKGFTCDICPKKYGRRKKLYKTQDILESHKRKVHQRMAKPFECKLCRKFFLHHYLLRRHMLAHPRLDNKIKKRNERHFCEECNREFKHLRNLKLHLQTRRHLPPGTSKKKKPEASNVYQYECLECDRKFKSKEGYKTHMTNSKYHNPELKYQCEFCSKGFMQKPSLDNHHAREHHVELNIEPIQCTFCSKKFSSKRNLENHVRVQHTKNTLFKCTECNMGFMAKCTYETHVAAVHTKEKRFQCADCPKRFSNTNHLNTHIRVHTGEKPYKCKDCGKEFADPPTFNRHRETHGNTTYTCAVCGRQFKVWHSYRIHMKRHNQHLSRVSTQSNSSIVDSTPTPASGNSTASSSLP